MNEHTGTMDGAELRDALAEMLVALREGESDPARRNEADARFRARYRECLVAGALPPAVEGDLRAALLAVAGADDWTRARAHLEDALHHVPPAG